MKGEPSFLYFNQFVLSPQSEIMIVVGLLGGFSSVTFGLVTGAPFDATPLRWSV
ncbi:hypothetical protein [Amycolatopsis sp. CA-128772]|uniref:hypothetical protein n=1 Tax=Amycolatopsis sp. CA-128772 TaxID=2073159 RepID=UPI001304D24D|nr:hypothetical protein [Amycolatopsis sp. CA-128772]